MSAKPTIIVYKESLIESIISDTVTFGYILLCIWASQGSNWWSFVTTTLLLFFIYVQFLLVKGGDNCIKFYSTKQLKEWIYKQEREK